MQKARRHNGIHLLNPGSSSEINQNHHRWRELGCWWQRKTVKYMRRITEKRLDLNPTLLIIEVRLIYLTGLLKSGLVIKRGPVYQETSRTVGNMILGSCNLQEPQTDFVGFRDTVRRRAHKTDSLLIEITLGFKFPPWSFKIVLGLVIKWSTFEGNTSAETFGWPLASTLFCIEKSAECLVGPKSWPKCAFRDSHNSRFQLSRSSC